MLSALTRCVAPSQLIRVQTGHWRDAVVMSCSAHTWTSGPFNWVAGQRSEPADLSQGHFDNVSPRTGRVLSRVARSGQQEINRAVAAARTAFPAWSSLSGQSLEVATSC